MNLVGSGCEKNRLFVDPAGWALQGFRIKPPEKDVGSLYMRGSRVEGDGGPGTLENHKNIGFLSNTDPIP